MSELKTNEDRIVHLMNFSKAGPIAQVIIICGIMEYLERMEKCRPATPDEPKSVIHPLISDEDWLKACSILKGELDEWYGKKAVSNLSR